MPLFKLAGATGTVTSVGLTAPGSILAVTGSPVTTAGVLALALVVQTANFVWAGPTVGAAANPTFRALVAADIPDLSAVYQPLNAKLTAIAALANASGALTNNGSGGFSYVVPTTGTVTSVALTVPSFLSVAGSPVTTSGTLAVTLATQTANQIFAGPTTGAAATPTFRALVAADFASIPATTFTMATARILGRTTAGTGAVEELTAGTSLSLSSGSLNTIQDIRTSATPTFIGVNGASGLILKNGGIQAVLIDASSNVIVGNQAVAGAMLDVQTASGTASTMRLFQNGISNWVFSVPASTDALIFSQYGTTERARFSSVGDFGIGGTPAVRLHVKAAAPTRGVISKVENSSSGTTGAFQSLVAVGANVWSFGLPAGSADLVFYTGRDESADGTETVRFLSSGASTFAGAVTATTYSAAVAGGGTMVTLNASTGTVNTGGFILFQRGAANKWSLGTGNSIGADAFEIYDRANSLSVFSLTPASGLATFAGNINLPSLLIASGASAGVQIVIPAGGGGLNLNAGTGTANTGMNVTWQRGGSSKWNLGTAISLGADAFELFDRANGVSALSIAASTSALTIRTSLTTGNPSGGTAQPVKLGSYVAGAPAATGYQQIEINGTAYKLLCST